MKVTIWDLDYYYAKEKVNCFNPDVMKISSYHKQCGDKVNFVIKADDIYRPYDLYYIIKENSKTPNPPFDFYTNSKVKWWGKANRIRINWKMSDVMMACRPDYLLYPEKNTVFERSEQLRFLNDKGDLLPIKQDWTNAFKNKKVIITDSNLWTTSRKNLIKVLEELKGIQNVSFFKPIWLPKLIGDEEIIQLFLELNLQQGSNLNWVPITLDKANDCIDLLKRFKEKWPYMKIGPLPIKIFWEEHWKDKNNALIDFTGIKEKIIKAKEEKIYIELRIMQSRLDSPYFLLFETIGEWTKEQFTISWLEWITKKYGPGLKGDWNRHFWSNPGEWNEVFRDLLRQTWNDTRFISLRWGDKSISENDIPWTIWKEEFRYGL